MTSNDTPTNHAPAFTKSQTLLLREVVKRIDDKLTERTSWGRNELKDAIRQIQLDLLEELAMAGEQ